jgi:serine phosphatase RsbU (regulator of sigma subunit)
LQLKSSLLELNQSITYAQYLQKSLIPNQNTINRYFEESSYLFKPKDKVSGDFYFTHEVNNNLYFGVGDCTGHGIPGGFLAAMSIEAVKTVILKNGRNKPDKILNNLREIAKERFSINMDDKRSGSMDAAICMYDKETEKLYYSDGFINLLIVRNKEIIITPATKCPIGSYPIEYPFELHEIDLQKGDVIYLSSDGYVDQFGYPKGSEQTKPSKFKRKRFRDLLVEISHLSPAEQVLELKSSLNEWRRDVEQIDDITIFIAKH